VNGQSAVDRHGLDDVADRVRQVPVIEVAPPAASDVADDCSPPLTTPKVRVVVSFRSRHRRWAQAIWYYYYFIHYRRKRYTGHTAHTCTYPARLPLKRASTATVVPRSCLPGKWSACVRFFSLVRRRSYFSLDGDDDDGCCEPMIDIAATAPLESTRAVTRDTYTFHCNPYYRVTDTNIIKKQ